jgi:hypothetical protein
MDGIHFDALCSEDERRRRLYQGQLFLLSPKPAALELIALAQQMSVEAFAPHDPRTAHRALPVEEYVRILASLKPRFIHHPRCKELLRQLLREAGCDLERTYFDVPRLRTAAPSNYLTTGIAYAFHPHRDTWYSAPQNQINWWMPVWPLLPENAMAFHPRYWSQPLRNGSRTYNYKRWNAESRYIAASQIGKDTRVQPKPEEEVETKPYVCLLPPPGGTICFSGAQLHSTIPNTTDVTRFSIDFRTVHIDDVWEGRGAPNIDSSCTGTSLGDFLRGSDFERIPQAAVDKYDTPEAA